MPIAKAIACEFIDVIFLELWFAPRFAMRANKFRHRIGILILNNGILNGFVYIL